MAFVQTIQAAMNQPQQLLYGEETFETACIRFTEAVNRIVATSQDETVALVSHGTILSLYIGSIVGKHPFDVWKMLHMPCYLVFSLPDMKVDDVCFDLPQS
jgi:broad specificity phosphatase PhoE